MRKKTVNLRLCDIYFRLLEILHTKAFAEIDESIRRCSSNLCGWAAFCSTQLG